jgi:hypothetical protein
MRLVGAPTVTADYGSDSAGMLITCMGALQTAHIAFAADIPLMLITSNIGIPLYIAIAQLVIKALPVTPV